MRRGAVAPLRGIPRQPPSGGTATDDLRGVVAAGHPESARAGAEALAAGGTAVDGALAAAFAAAVAESPLTGPGAGGFMLVRPPDGPAVVLDFFVAVPGSGPGGRRLDPRDLDSFTVPFGGAEQVFHIGPASVAVPGMIPGLLEAHRRYGRMPLGELTAPGARLAREGVRLTGQAAYLHLILADMLLADAAGAATYAPQGRLLGEGDLLRIPDLADTLEAIAREGEDIVRRGEIAQGMLGLMRARGGLVTEEDLAGYRVITREPLRASHRGVSLLTNPPPSSGGVLICAALDAIAGAAPASDDLAHYRAAVDGGTAADALRDAAFAAAVARGEDPRPRPDRKPTGSTTHVSVVDADGMMASLSSSNGSSSGVIVPGTGYLLNNMLGEQDLNPGGFGSGEPGARMTSMMAPSLLLRDGRPVAAVGSAGSNRLRSAILQTMLSLVDGGLGASEAVHRPRVHPELGVLDVEGGVPDAVAAALEAEGHVLRRWPERNLFFGGVSVAVHGPRGLEAAGDPRRGGGAYGVTARGEVVQL